MSTTAAQTFRSRLLRLLVGCTALGLCTTAAADTVMITGANSGIGLEFARPAMLCKLFEEIRK